MMSNAYDNNAFSCNVTNLEPLFAAGLSKDVIVSNIGTINYEAVTYNFLHAFAEFAAHKATGMSTSHSMLHASCVNTY